MPEVKGLDTFVSTMGKAAKALQDMDPAHSAASALIASAVAAAAPRRTGRLAGSVRAAGGRSGAVDVTAPYAGPIEWGWPTRHIDGTHFAMNAARATEPQWVKYYEDAVQKAVDEVRGA